MYLSFWAYYEEGAGCEVMDELSESDGDAEHGGALELEGGHGIPDLQEGLWA